MHNNSNMRNKQMVINPYKILPFFKIWRTHACKLTHFSWFRKFTPLIEKIPLFRETGDERGIRFGREWEAGHEMSDDVLTSLKRIALAASGPQCMMG